MHRAAQGEGDTDRWVEVRAGEGAEHQDEDREDRSGRQGIAQERKRCVAARELLRHDSGADDGGEQKGGPQPFRERALRQRRHQPGSLAFAAAASIRPISLSRCCRLS